MTLETKIKNLLSLLIIFAFLFTFPSSVFATTYYIDHDGGNNGWDGLTPETAWATIGKVNTITLNAGDTVLFQGGDTFTDSKIYLTTSGTSVSPITFGSYGTGRATITITGDNGLYAYNSAGVVVQDLIFTAPNFTSPAGIQFYTDTGARRDYIVIDNVDVSGFQHGISIGSWATGAGYSDVTISNSVLHANRDNGIITFGLPYDEETPFYAISDLTIDTVQANDNLGNAANSVSATGFGMDLGSIDTGIVDYVTVKGNGTANACIAVGPTGLMVYNSTAVIVQNSLAYNNGTNTMTDGDGFDLDVNTSNSTIQYCLAYNNGGSGILLFGEAANAAWTGNTVRYNLCWGNARNVSAGVYHAEIKLAGNTATSYIYNNTLVARNTGLTNPSAISIDATPTGIKVWNNILYGDTGPIVLTDTAWNSNQVIFQGNDYYRSSGLSINWGGTTYTSLADWRGAIANQEVVSGDNSGYEVNPLLVDATSSPTVTDPTVLTSADGLKLQSSSPVSFSGLDISSLFSINPGTRDYFNNTISVSAGIGAYESYNSPSPSISPSAPTLTPTMTTQVSNTSTTTSSTSSPQTCNSSVPVGSPNLFEVRTTKTSATLYFAPSSFPYSSFYVAYSRQPNNWEYGTEYHQGYSGGALSYTINLLKPNTTYYFKVRAGNGCATGNFGNTMMAKTGLTNQSKIFYKNYLAASYIPIKSTAKKSVIITTPIPTSIPRQTVPVSPTSQPEPVTVSYSTPTPNPTVVIPVPSVSPPPLAAPQPKKFCILWWCF